MSRAVLVGMPGVGKSTIGRAVAAALHCDFIDLDDALADTFGTSVAAFLREYGEEAFRQAEHSALRVAFTTDSIVSCGGGTVTYAPSRELLRAHRRVIWLDAPVATLTSRVATGDRPLLGTHHGAALEALRTDRAPLYRLVADATIDADRPVDEVVRDVVAAVGKLSP